MSISHQQAWDQMQASKRLDREWMRANDASIANMINLIAKYRGERDARPTNRVAWFCMGCSFLIGFVLGVVI